MDTPLRQKHELQFLSSALELQETPVHPVPRVFIWFTATLIIVILVWSYTGMIDIVAIAPGKIVQNGKTKLIQPSETAVISAIHVSEGQSVHVGDILVELDSTTAKADVGKINSELLALRIDEARATAMLGAINFKHPPESLDGAIPGASPDQVISSQNRLQGQYMEYESNIALVDAEIRQRNAEIRSAMAEVASLKKTLPIVTRLAEDYSRLSSKQYVSKHQYLEKEQARLDMQRQLNVQQASVIQHTAALSEARRRRDAVIAQNRRAMLDQQQEARQKIASKAQELRKANYEQNLTLIKAPVTGKVQQLNIHTIGGVVTPAQPLMVIVPSDKTVEVEASLENKDIGFVHPGQPVAVKVETFTFTRYGTIDGEVINVSGDAIDDEKRGLIYRCRIRLKSDFLLINGEKIALSPGMSVTAEIKTDKRRLIDYFLSPLQQTFQESFRER
ncbi:HlyD family type I secretion periplasmic adaptor subunit [Salmonella enterica]